MFTIAVSDQEEDAVKFYRERAIDSALVRFYAVAAAGYWYSPFEDSRIFISLILAQIVCLLTDTVCFCFE
jgi:hypothetical protein